VFEPFDVNSTPQHDAKTPEAGVDAVAEVTSRATACPGSCAVAP
jgi:hypothetical protein